MIVVPDATTFLLITQPDHAHLAAEILALWREADAVGVIEHAWLWDHMVPLRGPVNAAALEAWTLLAALAVQTDRLQLGVMVTSNRLRYPSVLAKMAATLDVISEGRLDLGMGAGWFEREFDAYGIPFPPVRDRVSALEESLQVMRAVWPC